MSAAEPACPICGGKQWEAETPTFMLRGTDVRVLRGGGAPVQAHICADCGFVRLHRLSEDAGGSVA